MIVLGGVNLSPGNNALIVVGLDLGEAGHEKQVPERWQVTVDECFLPKNNSSVRQRNDLFWFGCNCEADLSTANPTPIAPTPVGPSTTPFH